jgi:hypothetical protein
MTGKHPVSTLQTGNNCQLLISVAGNLQVALVGTERGLAATERSGLWRA